MFNITNPILKRFGRNLMIASAMIGGAVLFLLFIFLPFAFFMGSGMQVLAVAWIFLSIIVGVAGFVTLMDG